MTSSLNIPIPRESVVNSLREYLVSGMDVDLIGKAGSGRSTLLRMLAEQMKSAGWSVLSFEPVSVLQKSPLSSFNVAIAALRSQDRMRFQGTDVAYLEKVIDTRPLAVFFDDWNSTDEASWSIIARLRLQHNIPVISTHHPGLFQVRARHELPMTPGIAPASVRVPPFSIGELRLLLEATLNGPLENATLSHIYAKSAGLPGLAIAICQAARVEGRISLINGMWTAKEDLWSYAFHGIARRQMVGLTVEEMDALAKLSAANFIDVADALNLVPASMLENLEYREFIHADQLGHKKWVSVNPPILADYFRNDGYSVRSTRIQQELQVGKIASHASDDAGYSLSQARPTPLFFRLAIDRLESDLASSTRSWQEQPTPGTALAHLEALNDSHAPKSRIEKVLRRAVQLPGAPEELARLRVWHARWLANDNNDLRNALEVLKNRDSLGPYARLLDACESHLQLYFGTTSEELLDILDEKPEEDLPLSVRQELTRQRASVLLALARFDDAWETLGSVSSWDEDPHPHLLPALRALILLGRGEFAESMRIVLSDFLRARGEISIRSIQSSGNVLALLLLTRGQHAPLQAIGETILETGRIPYFPLTPMLGVICCVACNSNNEATMIEQLIKRAYSLPVPNGPFPGTSRSWPEARLKALTGSIGESAKILWESAAESHRRGRIFAACTDAIASLELKYTADRVQMLEEWMRSVHSPFIDSVLQFLAALHSGDAERLLDAAPALAATGRASHAVKAYQEALRLLTKNGQTDRAHEAEALLRDFESTFEPGTLDAHGATTQSPSTLTQRERDVAELVMAGLTNQMIAERLVLSVRTVENHIHRAMRKTGAITRQQLGQRITRV